MGVRPADSGGHRDRAAAGPSRGDTDGAADGRELLPDGLYYVTMAWVNAAGDEGACANPATFEVTGSGFRADPPAAPAGVTGWHVYAGTDAARPCARQNEQAHRAGCAVDPRRARGSRAGDGGRRAGRELLPRDPTRAAEGLMTAGIGSAATRKVMERLAGPTGGGLTVGALTEAGSEGAPMRAQNAAAELVERAGAVKYPLVSVYCEKVVNDLREKFRSFSGSVQMAIEVRHSQDRLEGHGGSAGSSRRTR